MPIDLSNNTVIEGEQRDGGGGKTRPRRRGAKSDIFRNGLENPHPKRGKGA